MKKIRLNIAILATVFAAIFSSCDKDVESTAVVLDLNDSATITLYMFADLDKTVAGLETVPAGTQVYVKINYSQFRSGVDGAWIKTVSVGTGGLLTLDVPADDNGVTVMITPLPFEAAQVQAFGKFETTVNKLFTANQTNISVSAGEYKSQQITYNAPENFNDFVAVAHIEGNITANINDTIAGSEDVEMAVELTFHTDEWNQTLTTNAEGEFSLEVPVGTTIRVTGIFITEAYISGDEDDYEYEIKGLSIGSFSAETEGVVVNFGNGVIVE